MLRISDPVLAGHTLSINLEMKLMSKIEQDILAKLQAHGLNIDSPEEEIMKCLGRCVGAIQLMRVAATMLYEYRKWQRSDDGAPLWATDDAL
jgi:hypothetical protein